ncbi:hypothetical protein HHK36_004613 [Tetracentron sinense]|uniref:Acid phosphatase/vanadium-dependent haloperoxidase-related protein n=1 Tax=Tetracentron sinense TaxID=13715 RepID=A0A834ZN27_TETSI|nr:hypothetical protein HHK36_004613 [Tetracentron sinense]
MLLYSAICPSPLPHNIFSALSKKQKQKQKLILNNPASFRKQKKASFICLSVGIEDILEIAQNKVLIAATVSAAIGQLSKPFTSALLYGNDVDFKASIQAGGFPSTHSSGVVAAATILGLERGFSDSIFGITVVYAALVMYDAQGVRREVGNHAKALNRTILKTQENSTRHRDEDDVFDSQPGTSYINSESLTPLLCDQTSSCISSSPTNAHLLLGPENRMGQLAVDEEEGSQKAYNSFIPLKESIGHTEIEVTAGALLGFFVSLAIYIVM